MLQLTGDMCTYMYIPKAYVRNSLFTSRESVCYSNHWRFQPVEKLKGLVRLSNSYVQEHALELNYNKIERVLKIKSRTVR